MRPLFSFFIRLAGAYAAAIGIIRVISVEEMCATFHDMFVVRIPGLYFVIIGSILIFHRRVFSWLAAVWRSPAPATENARLAVLTSTVAWCVPMSYSMIAGNHPTLTDAEARFWLLVYSMVLTFAAGVLSALAGYAVGWCANRRFGPRYQRPLTGNIVRGITVIAGISITLAVLIAITAVPALRILGWC